MNISSLDVAYRKLIITKFFTKGWGSPDHIQKLFNMRKIISKRESCCKLVQDNYPIEKINEINKSDYRIINGKFRSPLADLLPGVVPEDVQEAYFQMILPRKWSSNYKPVCIHLAGTGDHYFWRRRNLMAKSLLKAGIGAIILENPYYGLRKPKSQIRSNLRFVSDIFVMGGCLILECLVLLNLCERLGFGPLGVTGISMGGHMASLAATNWPKPLVLVPCLSWSTASSVFTEGVMSESINWDLLQTQYLSNKLYCDKLSKLCRIVDDPFACNLNNLPHVRFDSVEAATNVTPYQLINFINDVISNNPNITFKASDLNKKQLSTITHSKKVREMKKRDREALWFMRGIMDECTHLKHFSVPYDTSLIISICAKADGYVPRQGVATLEHLWPGVEVKYVECGHVGAYLWYRKVFKESIIRTFDRAKQKYPPPKSSMDHI